MNEQPPTMHGTMGSCMRCVWFNDDTNKCSRDLTPPCEEFEERWNYYWEYDDE